MSRRQTPHPLWALTRARLLEFVREPGALFWVFVFPVLLAVGLGIAFRAQPEQQARVAIIRATPDAKQLARQLSKTRGFAVKVLSRTDALAALRRGRLDLVIGPGKTTKAGKPSFRFYFDKARSEARLARHTVAASLQRACGQVDLISIQEVTTREQGGRYIDFLIPGLIGLNLMGSGMWGIGFVVVQNRTKKLLKRFAVTPMRRSHYLLSFMLSRLIFLVLEVAALIIIGLLIFDVRIHGSILALALVSTVGALSFTGIALLVAARPQSIEAASGWMNFVMLPMWLLSGSFFSYERFPELFHPLIRALPLTAINDALRRVMNDGGSLFQCWMELGLLVAWGGASFVIALRIFRWR